VASRYFNLIRDQTEIRNFERQLENFKWLSARIQALADAGREPYFEVQRAQQQELFAANNLSNSRERYLASLDTFKVFIGMPIEQPLAIRTDIIDVPDLALEERKAVETALQNRLDLQTQRDRVTDARRRVRNARNELLPDLDLNASVSAPTDADKSRGGVDFDLTDGAYAASLDFSTELDKKLEKTAYRAAAIGLERAARDYRQDRDEVAAEVRDAIRQIRRSRFTLKNQELNIELSEKRLRGVLLRLRTLGPRDFIEAQDDLLEARLRRDDAERDLRVAILNYLLNTGQMRVNATGRWLAPAGLRNNVERDVMPDARQLLNGGEVE